MRQNFGYALDQSDSPRLRVSASFAQIYGLLYLAFSIVWFYKGPEDEKYLYEDTLDWDENRLQACLSGGIAVGVLVPIAGLLHLGVFRCVRPSAAAVAA